MSYLRPDEKAALTDIEKSKRKDMSLKSTAKTGLKAVGTAAIGGIGAGLSSKILPFLSEYITPDLALKGISKLSPKTGDFLRNGMEKGLNLKDGLDYIKQNIGSEETEPAEEKKEKENQNIIQQYSPNLNEYIKDLISTGEHSPSSAAALAKRVLSQKSKDIISKIEKDHKTDFVSIVESIFGGGKGLANPQSAQQTQQTPQQAPGQGQQALMAILQKIQQSRGAK